MGARYWIAAGFLMLSAGVVSYLYLYFAHEAAFTGQKLRHVIYNLVSHVPDDDASAGFHILAGVLFSCGVALVIGGSVVTLPFVVERSDDSSLFMTVAAFVFGIEISTLSFWTLWQTRRIEQIQGSEISGFTGLIDVLGRDVNVLLADLKKHNFSATAFHRFYLVTTNPFLGQLSFPNEAYTLAFENALRTAARWVAECKKIGSKKMFDVQLLCGTPEAIVGFHQQFYSTNGVRAADTDPRVLEASKRVESLLEELGRESGGAPILHRIRQVPKVQFAVVGNTVFEFVLDTPGVQSEVHRARRIQEKVMCDRFVETFELLKQLP